MPFTLVRLALVTLLGGGALVQTPSLPLPADAVAWVLLVDDLHLDFRNTGRIRDFLKTLLNDVVRDGDLAAIHTTGPSKGSTQLVSPRDLSPVLKTLTGSGMKPNEIVAALQEAGRETEELRLRAQMTLSGARAAVRLLAFADSRRRAVLYLGNGYTLETDTSAQSRELISAARAIGVRIFAFDGANLDGVLSAAAPSDPEWHAYRAAARESLKTIAQQTGGFAVFDSRDMMPALLDLNNPARR